MWPRVTKKAAPPTLDERALARLVERSLEHGARALYEQPSLYERLYVRRKQDIVFYVAMATRLGGPVLELGTGAGRVAIAMARAGIAVRGVDVAADMLAEARRRIARLPKEVRALITLQRADMRRLRLDRRFPLVVAPFNVFSHLYKRTDLERVLRTCKEHMRARGQLIFDVVMPDMQALAQDPSRLYRCGELVKNHKRFRYSEASHYDPVLQTRSMTLLLSPKHGNPLSRAVPLTHRQYFPAELEALLHYNGFRIEARYGDFDLGPLTEESRSQVIVAGLRKR